MGLRVLVTGANGQLGHDVVACINEKNHKPIATDIEEMDITDSNAVLSYISYTKPDAVIHCAAYTAVDKAEDNIDLCRKINKYGTENIAIACKKADIPMIYISTDYVFNGEGDAKYKPEDETAPINVYGLTKLEGELAVKEHLSKYFIVRISWVFGVNGNNFVKTMLRLGQEKGIVNVVCDQFGSPTYTHDLAKLLVDMTESDKYGTYHATNEGICSWYEFAKEIFKTSNEISGFNMRAEVIPVNSDVFPVKAKRPQNSRMSKHKLEENGFDRLPSWQDALKRYLGVVNGKV